MDAKGYSRLCNRSLLGRHDAQSLEQLLQIISNEGRQQIPRL